MRAAVLVLLSIVLISPAFAQTAPQAGTQTPYLPALPPLEEDPAVASVINEVAPLQPEQIRELRKLLDRSERAAAQPPRFVPKPVSSQVVVTLKPGETPPVVRLGANFVTNILFVDQSGNPLLITDVDISAAKLFTTTWSKDTHKNVVKISPNSTYAMGNISVTLQGVPAPVSLTLIAGQREVDYRVDVRVATGPIDFSFKGGGEKLPAATNAIMRSMLEGIAPEDAKPLQSSNRDVQAWALGDRFYLRTSASYTLLSPAHLAVERSADGTAVYELLPTPIVVTLVGGTTTKINLSGY